MWMVRPVSAMWNRIRYRATTGSHKVTQPLNTVQPGPPDAIVRPWSCQAPSSSRRRAPSRVRLRVPGDKSIAHRYALLAAMAAGRSVIRGFAPGADCRSTLSCLEGLGAQFSRSGDLVTVIGRGPGGFSSPHAPLDAGNSGTTARLLAGLLAGLPFSTTLTGDDSLRRRPMRRVIEPLSRMGARVESDGGRLPMTVRGGPLEAIAYVPEVPSAQVKSAVLLAGLQRHGHDARHGTPADPQSLGAGPASLRRGHPCRGLGHRGDGRPRNWRARTSTCPGTSRRRPSGASPRRRFRARRSRSSGVGLNPTPDRPPRDPRAGRGRRDGPGRRRRLGRAGRPAHGGARGRFSPSWSARTRCPA